MNALLIVANPSPESFSHAIAEAAAVVLERKRYRVVLHDLYAEHFNPVQSVAEGANTSSLDPLVEQHCMDLAAADLIVVVHPNWWSQPPAILKGWIDRVFRLNTAYAYPEGVGFDGVPVGLLRARHALIFNTSNTPLAREQALFGDPLESLWKTSVFALCGVSNVTRRMFAPVASSSFEQRGAWLEEVRAVVEHAA